MEKTGRRPRIHIPNTVHHVMVRGNNRQRIFFNKEDFLYFLEIIENSTKKFDHKLLTYCFMTNHVHLVISIKNSSLSAIMQNINFRYARYINRKHNRIGHVFQGRYRSLQVSNETYLINLCRYIHYNPVAAKIVSHPNDYLWSSHRQYLSHGASNFIDCTVMIEAIKNKTGLSYLEFISQPVDRGKWKPSLFLSESGAIIIDDSIMQKLNSSTKTSRSVNKVISKNSIEKAICEHLLVDVNELYGSSKNHKISQKRAWRCPCQACFPCL